MKCCIGESSSLQQLILLINKSRIFGATLFVTGTRIIVSTFLEPQVPLPPSTVVLFHPDSVNHFLFLVIWLLNGKHIFKRNKHLFKRGDVIFHSSLIIFTALDLSPVQFLIPTNLPFIDQQEIFPTKSPINSEKTPLDFTTIPFHCIRSCQSSFYIVTTGPPINYRVITILVVARLFQTNVCLLRVVEMSQQPDNMSLSNVMDAITQNGSTDILLKKFHWAIKKVANEEQLDGKQEGSKFLTQDELIQLVRAWEPKRDIMCLYVRWARQLRRNFNLDSIATLLCLSRQCEYTPVDFLR